MLAVAALQLLLLILIIVLLTRKPASAQTDARLATLPDAILKLAAKLEAGEATLRNHILDLRREQTEKAAQAHLAAEQASRNLREEIAHSINLLAKPLHEGIAASRNENTEAADKLRDAMTAELNRLNQQYQTLFTESVKREREATEILQQSLSRMATEQREAGEALKKTVESGLRTLNTDNASKLDEMRVIVDEKLQSTLNERLTASFSTVSDQLTKVHSGLGEMKELATGVSDLKKVFTNVKARGGAGEFFLGQQLAQMFSPEQYEKNIAIKPNSAERVEFALKVPQGQSVALLPMDSKFPQEDWARLEAAYEVGGEELRKAGDAFERGIRAEAKKICDKYIYEPTTLPHAILFLPTEALYGEVTRRSGLIADIQQNCKVTIAGPSTFGAILTAFRMGFHLITLERKGSEVWDTLRIVKSEFVKFGDLVGKVEGNVERVQKTLGELGVRTRAINRNLREVSELPPTAGSQQSFHLALESATVAPALLASDEDEA